MRALFALALVACSNSGPAPQEELEPVGLALPPPPRQVYVENRDAMALAASPEIDAALKSLWSDHERDVPPIAWWKQHAAEVRPQLTSWLADGKDDGHGDLRAIRILGDIGEFSDVEVLVHVLTTWTSETARTQAAASLGAHASPGVTISLVDATNNPNVAIAGLAASALGKRKQDEAARTRLEELIAHDNRAMRVRAVDALSEMGGSREALQKRKAVETDTEVKAALAKALASKR